MKWLKHAFAVDDGPVEPTPEQQVAVDWFCLQVAKRHLSTPGLIGLEMSRPLNFIASQAMHFCEPAVWAIAPQLFHTGYKEFAAFLEKRGAIDYLCRRIEHFEQECERALANLQRPPGASKDPSDEPAEP